MALHRPECVAKHVGAQARAAHSEQDDVGVIASVFAQRGELVGLFEHLVRDVKPSQAVVDLLPLGGVGAPEGRVLRPQTAWRVVLLQLRDLRIDRRLEPAEAEPLTRSLAGFDVLGALLQRGQQALERLGERLHALHLELVRDLVQAHAYAGELLQLATRQIDVLVEAAADLAVLAERGQRRGRDRVHGVGADELFDVVGVRIARVLGRGAGPQAPLAARAGFAQLVPARTGKELLVALIGHLRVGDGRLAQQLVQRPLLLRILRLAGLLGQDLVDLGVHAADEKARHAGHLAEVAAIFVQLLQPCEVSLDHLRVAIDRKDQGDVDVVALGDLVEDRGQSFLGRGDLHHHVRPPAALAQVLGHPDRAARVVGERRRDLDADESVLALCLVVDGAEGVGRRLDVLDHQLPQHLGRLLLLTHQLDHRLVVVGRAADRLLEDRRVGGHAGQAFVAQSGQLAGADELAADVVEPQGLTDLLQLLDRVRFGLGSRRHHFACASLVAAATMLLLEIPAAFISSSGLPDSGNSLTARWTTRGGGSAANASSTAAPMPPCG